MSLSVIINCLGILLFASCWILIIVKLIKNKISSVKTVNAVVVDKYKTQAVSGIPGRFKRKRYIVVFLADEERLAFDVSEFSFQGYRIKERATLKYKGDRLIDFS